MLTFEDVHHYSGDEVYADLNGWRLYLRDMKADGSKTMAQVRVSGLETSLGWGVQLRALVAVAAYCTNGNCLHLWDMKADGGKAVAQGLAFGMSIVHFRDFLQTLTLPTGDTKVNLSIPC